VDVASLSETLSLVYKFIQRNIPEDWTLETASPCKHHPVSFV
jgi:hypothetical protein